MMANPYADTATAAGWIVTRETGEHDGDDTFRAAAPDGVAVIFGDWMPATAPQLAGSVYQWGNGSYIHPDLWVATPGAMGARWREATLSPTVPQLGEETPTDVAAELAEIVEALAIADVRSDATAHAAALRDGVALLNRIGISVPDADTETPAAPPSLAFDVSFDMTVRAVVRGVVSEEEARAAVRKLSHRVEAANECLSGDAYEAANVTEFSIWDSLAGALDEAITVRPLEE